MNATDKTKLIILKVSIASFLESEEAARVRNIFRERGGEIFIGEFEGVRFALRAKGICHIEEGNDDPPLATCFDIEDAFVGKKSAAPAERRTPEELIPFLLEKCREVI